MNRRGRIENIQRDGKPTAHHSTTADANPTISPDFLAAEEARDPDGFRQEYLAEFTGSGDAYIDFDRVEISAPGPAPPESGTRWVAGLDPAFARDPFGLVLVGRSREDRRRLVVGEINAFKASGNFAAPVDLVGEIADRYRARIVTDQYAAAPVVERLRSGGRTVRVNNMTATTKTAIFAALRGRLYDGTLALPERPPELIAELRRLRTKFTANQAAVVNPRVGGSHGDMAQALALAVAEHRRHSAAAERSIVTGTYEHDFIRDAPLSRYRTPVRGVGR